MHLVLVCHRGLKPPLLIFYAVTLSSEICKEEGWAHLLCAMERATSGKREGGKVVSSINIISFGDKLWKGTEGKAGNS